MLSSMPGRRFFAVFTLAVYILFGALAAIAAIIGIVGLISGNVGLGLILLVIAAVLGIMSVLVKRSFDQVVND